MLYNAKNSSVKINNSSMDYISFGSGKKVLVMLPGLGESLQSVKGPALPMAFMYRRFAREYTVYIFSRRDNLPQGYTTADMSADLKCVLDTLGIGKIFLVGVSMGGMIAQHFAADYQQYVEKLALVVTCAKPNNVAQKAINHWIKLVKKDDYKAFMDSNVKLIYSDRYYRKNKLLVPFVSLVTKPKKFDRFFVQADACLSHNAYDMLQLITCPVIVIGGEKDMVVGGDASREIAGAIKGSTLKMYSQWGHGLYEEAKDFIDTVADFFRQ
ncbi:MAG: alpha/beta hydrolase [Oscillospiraceae bacterium]|nr:alpha/beta hydrolase [Oscillospiraceae bacterium]